MKLIDRLAGTYTLTAQSVVGAGERWQRLLEYPQLPSCRVETFSVEDGLEALDRSRIRTIVRLVTGDQAIPDPTGTRPIPAVLMELRDLDLLADLAPILYRDEDELRGSDPDRWLSSPSHEPATTDAPLDRSS